MPLQKAELGKLDIPELTSLYLAESQHLHEALLQGTDWENLAEQRKYVTTIGVLIDAKKNATRDTLIVATLQTQFLR